MKKLFTIIFLILTITVLTGCSNNSLKRITYDDFEKMIKNNETFVIEISQDGCSHCTEYAPIIKKVIKDNDITIYNLNLTYLSERDSEKLSKDFNVDGTPTTLFFKKGQEVFSSRIAGSTTEKKLTKTLKRLKYIK